MTSLFCTIHDQAITSSLHEEALKVGLIVNVAKTKIMRVGDWTSAMGIKVGQEELEECDEFCYLGSTIGNDAFGWARQMVHLDGWGESGQVETSPLR